MRRPRRFDDALMEPPDPGAPVDAALLASLRAWCEGGAFPTLTEPLRVASIAPHAALDGVACALDGSHELARIGRWRGLAWRLQILLRESVAEPGALPGVPWDCGWWREGALGSVETFRPRRATLLMVKDPTPKVAAALLSALSANIPIYDKPVRALLVATTGLEGVSRI